MLNQSCKIFMIAGVVIFLSGYFMHVKEIADITGALFMISGSSLMAASLVEFILRRIHYLTL